LTVGSLSQLKDTPMLERVANSVFWLDVFGYNLEIMKQLARVRGKSKEEKGKSIT